MLALALLLFGCAVLQSDALPALVQYQAKDELGQYSYGYSGGPSAKQEERTLDGVTRGSYSYIDGNGLVQTRSYEADDLHGFRVVGTDIAAPSGVSRSGTILSSTGVLPVSDHSPSIKTYRDFDNIKSFSGNEISIAPVPYSVHKADTVIPYTARKTITPYASPVEYLRSPYRYRVIPEATRYYRQHYISPNSIDVSPLSSVGVRVPTTSYSEPIRPIAYTDSLGVQSTVTPPTVQTASIPAATVATPVHTVSIQESAIPARTSVSYTPTYQTASSQIVSNYVPNQSVSYRPRVVAISNPIPAPISYLDAAPGPVTFTSDAPPAVAISGSSPSVVTYTKGVPAAAFATATPPTVSISDSVPVAVTYTKAVPAAAYTYATASPPTISISNPSPVAVTYTNTAPAVTYSSPAVDYSSPAVDYSSPAVDYSSPPVTYSSDPVVSYNQVSTPFTYGYYPTTSNIFRYASTAPSVRATVYEPEGGYLAAKPVPLQEAIATQYHAQDEFGQYRYGYANINSAKEETKTIDGVTRGSFSYVDANGVLQSRSYISDDVNGFRVIGTDIPKDPNGHVNPDAIPSEHVAPAVAAAVSAPVAAPVATFHSQQVVATAVPATLVPHNAVEVNAPIFVSSTPAPISILKK